MSDLTEQARDYLENGAPWPQEHARLTVSIALAEAMERIAAALEQLVNGHIVSINIDTHAVIPDVPVRKHNA
jgi:hypothetical protein